jgi:large conductance mechanosensitive channel
VPFKNLEVVIKPAVLKPGTQEVLHEAVAVHYGLFINTVLEFLIVAFTVFMVVKFVNRLTRLREMISPPEPQAGPGPSSAPTPPAAP